MPTHTRLKGISDVRQSLLIEQIAENLIEFFNWALLEAEGFVNESVLTPGTDDPYALEQLMPVHLEGVPDGKIWEAVKSNWVWETGLEVPTPPVVPTGVYVDGTFYNPPGHYINFPEGRVVFEIPLPLSSVVQCEYAYRWINLYDMDVPWYRNVVFDALLVEEQAKAQGGVIGLLQQNRAQLPLVVIEPVTRRRMKGKELGSGAHTIFQDVLFHVVAETSDDRDKIVDIISLNQDKTIYLYDVNARVAANEFALDWRGSKINEAKMYPDLVELPPVGFRWKKCFFNRMVCEEVTIKLPLHRGIVRATLEVDFSSM